MERRLVPTRSLQRIAPRSPASRISSEHKPPRALCVSRRALGRGNARTEGRSRGFPETWKPCCRTAPRRRARGFIAIQSTRPAGGSSVAPPRRRPPGQEDPAPRGSDSPRKKRRERTRRAGGCLAYRVLDGVSSLRGKMRDDLLLRAPEKAAGGRKQIQRENEVGSVRGATSGGALHGTPNAA